MKWRDRLLLLRLAFTPSVFLGPRWAAKVREMRGAAFTMTMQQHSFGTAGGWRWHTYMRERPVDSADDQGGAAVPAK